MSEVTAPVPDVLPGWVARTIRLAPDGEAAGPPVATLVQRDDAGTRDRAVLYLHGFTDYFFQTEHAARWAEAGYDFYALELRDYGRSIRPGRVPNFVMDLAAYDEELTAALQLVREGGYGRLVVLGHSTGGLIAPLYLDRHPDVADTIDALVLNSPWFDLNAPWFDRVVATRAIDLLGRFRPMVRVDSLGEDYGRSLHTSTGGSWDYDLTWKPFEDVPAYAGWGRAVRRGHARIGRGLDLTLPVLVCTSARSGARKHPTAADLAGADCVLDVRQMHARAPRLGPDVTIETIDGGRHDLALSEEPARTVYTETVLTWLERRLGP